MLAKNGPFLPLTFNMKMVFETMQVFGTNINYAAFCSILSCEPFTSHESGRPQLLYCNESILQLKLRAIPFKILRGMVLEVVQNFF